MDQGRIKVNLGIQTFYIIKNYNNEPVDFVGNWGVTHFEQLVVTRDGSNIRIRLPNYKYLIFENTAPCAFSYKNFHLPVGFSGYSVIPRKNYMGTEEDDSYQALEFLGSILNGLGGNDRLTGSFAPDIIEGGHGDDTIYGRGNSDTLLGQLGNDLIFGGQGSDEIQGGDGEDKLYGEEDDDIIIGGSGNDILNGGSGENTLTGGLGADIFEIPYEKGIHLITDFDLAEQRGSDAYLKLPNHQILILKNTYLSDLRSDLLIFDPKHIPQKVWKGTDEEDVIFGHKILNNLISGLGGQIAFGVVIMMTPLTGEMEMTPLKRVLEMISSMVVTGMMISTVG